MELRAPGHVRHTDDPSDRRVMTPTTKLGIGLALLIVVILVARAGEDHRNDHPAAAASGPVSIAQVSQRLESQGYQIRKIKEDDGRYKVTVLTPDRHKEKLSISPRTGEVIGKKNDDEDDDED
ncbi:PepSY domain-containing protein [Rhodopila globiformis]|uniref:PepSY domain-containing protein n=1 Tax=Rhodopila globiformis TaxID=1071 RepID=UPI001304F206|nr:PepSY domain-containing protein [Rhodopila globiformis]